MHCHPEAQNLTPKDLGFRGERHELHGSFASLKDDNAWRMHFASGRCATSKIRRSSQQLRMNSASELRERSRAHERQRCIQNALAQLDAHPTLFICKKVVSSRSRPARSGNLLGSEAS